MYFDNIIGQDFAKKYLTNSIKKNKINHAYMFEGIDGIGKKKLSQELSKILLDISLLVLNRSLLLFTFIFLEINLTHSSLSSILKK